MSHPRDARHGHSLRVYTAGEDLLAAAAPAVGMLDHPRCR
jgi:hypothetical protein